jgi:hypothetical protein
MMEHAQKIIEQIVEGRQRTWRMSRTVIAGLLLAGSATLWRVAVHSLKLAMGEGEGRRHIH